jgi:FKBP-type peptidyl-prolyl cis-trans isomerase FkpA
VNLKQKIASFFKIILLGLTMSSAAQAATAEENKTAGAAFLAENAKKAGIVTTASGLQYEVLTQGTGTKSPSATDLVEVNYEGKLLDGTVFDSSYKRGESISFPLNRVIAGWTEGLQLMTEGAKHRLYIPSDLAYGTRGAGRDIGANATLIFDVELLKIK